MGTPPLACLAEEMTKGRMDIICELPMLFQVKDTYNKQAAPTPMHTSYTVDPLTDAPIDGPQEEGKEYHVVNGTKIQVYHENEKAEQHLKRGAWKVTITTPLKDSVPYYVDGADKQHKTTDAVAFVENDRGEPASGFGSSLRGVASSPGSIRVDAAGPVVQLLVTRGGHAPRLDRLRADESTPDQLVR